MVDFFSILTGMATSIGGAASSTFTGNFLAGFAGVNGIFLLMMFVVFVFIMRKAMSTIINFIIVGVASASFPIFLNYIGMTVPITSQTLVFFVVLGLAAYIIFIIGRYILKFLGIFSKKQSGNQ